MGNVRRLSGKPNASSTGFELNFIVLPEIFKALNAKKLSKNDWLSESHYEEVTKNHGKASECLKCGLCLEVCPNYTYGSNFFGASFANDMYLLYSSQTEGDKKILMAYKEHFVSNCSKALSCQNVCPAKIDTLTSIINMNRVKE